jgi:hypothetical protein
MPNLALKSCLAGRFTTHGDEKGVYRLYPDGRKEYIEGYPEGNKGG